MQMIGGRDGGGGGSRSSHSSPSHASAPAGQREAQPTGDGPGYDDPDIPF
jgi:single-strand DNA-binding protein